uniref:DUF6429 family protein n=1 Tax=Paenirhodobacter populi TaxID=2306993 RepID=UPI0037427D42
MSCDGDRQGQDRRRDSRAALPDARPRRSRLEGVRLERDEPAAREGLIGDPVNKAKSVWLTEEGIARSERLFKELFGVYDKSLSASA